MREGSLNANLISVRWGWKQEKIRSTKIKEVGPYRAKLMVGHCGENELEDLAKRNDILLTYKTTVVEEGWLGKPKKLLQVLWERRWINEKKIDKQE